MTNYRKRICLPSLVFFFLVSTNFALAQQPAVRGHKANKYGCLKQPKQELGSPKITNFCECFPSGFIYADPAAIAGEVDIQFEVDVDGTLIDHRVLKSSGYKKLDRMVLKGTGNCKFEPAHKDGVAKRSFLIQRYILEDSDEFNQTGRGGRVENGSVK